MIASWTEVRLDVSAIEHDVRVLAGSAPASGCGKLTA
jgi:hypothetical protein